ncbi:MAG: hypothetical protein JO329_10110 [Planctomycetaceae bacterium]|nr:hypothetical protein [Planctomycetaceae bacterium]
MSVPMIDSRPRAPARDGSHQPRRAELLFREAGVSARSQVLLAPAEGEGNIGASCAETAQTCPAPAHHLEIMRRLGLVDAGGQDRQRSYRQTVLGEQLVATIDALLELTTIQEIDRGSLEGYTESQSLAGTRLQSNDNPTPFSCGSG